MKKLVFGLGSGRCGSASLAYLLSHQESTHASHELFPILPWKVNTTIMTKKWTGMDHQSHLFDVVTDSGSYFLPYVPVIFNSWHQHEYAKNRYGLKFICLKRDKEKTVQSYLNKFRKQNNNPLQNHNDPSIKTNEWDLCFPKYDGISLEEAISKYYDEYYSVCDFWESKYSPNFRIFSTETLNSKIGVEAILNFVGYENPNIVTGIQKRKH